eukprot:760786-Hanusia_phi.AAC.2
MKEIGDQRDQRRDRGDFARGEGDRRGEVTEYGGGEKMKVEKELVLRRKVARRRGGRTKP